MLDSLDSSSTTAKSNSNSDSVTSSEQREDEELYLSYDVRARGTPMETSRSAARATLERCIARLQELVPGVERDRSVRLMAVTPYVQTFRTTFGREVCFVYILAQLDWLKDMNAC